jgi:two-component system response regulator HydG
MNDAHILVIDDDVDVLHTARIVLKPHFAKVVVESNPQQINFLLSNQQFDVVLLDMNFTTGATSGQDGLTWLQKIREIKPDQQVVMMTAYGDIKLAVEAMKRGAADFIVKPWENEKFLATIQLAYEHGKSKEEIKTLKAQQSSIHQMLIASDDIVEGESEAMKQVLKQVQKVAGTDANVLILGENGTGKEEIAKLLHKNSLRNKGPFIKVDLGAITETLFESELFGHVKGAFTDAKEDRHGRFILSDGGTLFLDEIGNLSLTMQAKLLSILQNKEVTPVGGSKPAKVNNRVIAATNCDIQKGIVDKTFREDLLYRLNTVTIVLPPLRERVEDLPALANHFLKSFNTKYGKYASFEAGVIDELKGYRWPGNIRELMHAIERAVIMSDADSLAMQDFLINQNNLTSNPLVDTVNLDDIERNTIERALKKFEGNISKAAKELGLGRTTIYRKMDKYGIKY